MMLSDWLARTRALSGVLPPPIMWQRSYVHTAEISGRTYMRRWRNGISTIIRNFPICAASSRRASASSHDSRDNNNVPFYEHDKTAGKNESIATDKRRQIDNDKT